MFFVMESKNDVIIVERENDVELNKGNGFKLVGFRKTLKGATRLAEKRCEL